MTSHTLNASTHDPAEVCDQAAKIASGESDVPLAVLRAITRTETGRTRSGELQPWPWTVNMEGEGVWFESEDAARAYVFRHFKRGARSFDVGCFQLNYKWHGQAFRSIDEMFEPVLNARYAASFLETLYREHGDWTLAAGAYHSRTPKYASRYIRRYQEIQAGLSAAPEPQPRQSVNAFPLLQSGQSGGRNGSLMPTLSGRASFLARSGS